VAKHIGDFSRELTRRFGGHEEKSDRITEFLNRMTSAYGDRDAERFSSLFSSDMTFTDVNRRQVIEGREAWRGLTQRVMEAHHWMKLEAKAFSTSTDRATVRLRYSGLLKGEALGRGDDVPYDYEGVSLMSFDGGEISRHDLFIDHAGFRDQIGDPDVVRRTVTVETTWRDYTAAWNSGVPERIAAFIDENAYLLPSEGEAMNGRGSVSTARGEFGWGSSMETRRREARLVSRSARRTVSLPGSELHRSTHTVSPAYSATPGIFGIHDRASHGYQT